MGPVATPMCASVKAASMVGEGDSPSTVNRNGGIGSGGAVAVSLFLGCPLTPSSHSQL